MAGESTDVKTYDPTARRCCLAAMLLCAHGEEHLAKANGFSLHAGVWAGANDRAKLERLCIAPSLRRGHSLIVKRNQ